jgi:HEPN domain-containing protein
MSPQESLYSADWLRIAEKDLRRARRSLGDNDPEMAGFCLQQAIEKFLKAFLLSKGWQLRRIHSLEALLDDAITYDPTLGDSRDLCQKISAFYILERYPLVVEAGVTDEDVRVSLEQADGLIGRLRAGTVPP